LSLSDKKQLQAEQKADATQTQIEQKIKKEVAKDDKQVAQKNDAPTLANLLQGGLKQKEAVEKALREYREALVEVIK
jgi:hypothetical protein